MGEFSGYVTVFEQKFAAAPADTLAVIGGYATKWWNLHVFGSTIDAFARTCFDQSIVFGKDVKFLVNHDWKKEVGGTSNGLELMADPDGLAFRYPLPDTDLGREALSMIRSGGGQAGMSVGYKVLEQKSVEIDRQKVRVLTRCDLSEISIVKVGAVPGAFTQVKTTPGDELKLAADAAAINLRWALHDFGKAAEKLAQKALAQ
ncbi:HK97 family phage prohead protease [Mesorhizobium sp. M4B.F.Ca.ET.013.02.1.1]|uniref:HK97 family phage prohead protease n=1 Tax=Mesorhizobium sp. M4B.F.Ca.ET.013.02.1.1 TaxID=2496755 RepID=UPI000FD4710B|nr:HK97 family phage prohead protease [Mesorhizobium sp. M4B.F.Ca.ET.013.02.1.1]RUW17379.1 HK97 family phage prohead protease [Mesorhizobium sp. M4B.F.Ca.ET.013.02.1.1]